MIINNNMMAKNSHRMLGINASTMGKSTEKLSSGLRVNRAADDAAGLSISEKMRGQIRGLTQASRNSQDAISVVQTAEGALDEAHSILQRMRQLAVQSANDSNVNIDRASLQQEVSQLTNELDRIADTTEFNTQKLLDGSFSGRVFHVGANTNQNLSISIDKMSANGLGLRKDVAGIAAEVTAATTSITELSASIANLKIDAVSIKSIAGDVTLSIASMTQSLNEMKANMTNATTEASAAYIAGSIAFKEGSIAAAQASLASLGRLEKERVDAANVSQNEIDALKAKLGADGGVYIATQKNANDAIKTINDALTMVSRQRSDLGAIQNRLEHTIRNLDNAAENTQAAESRIRDIDMAKEMSEFTKKNILTQASQAMLAQANQLPQQVLQLLR